MSRGFTLLELMVTIVILAIVASLSTPTFITTIQNNRTAAASNDFYTTIIQARNEAIKRNQSVVICKSNDGANCANSGDWEQGWIAYVDIDSDSVLDIGETIFTQHEPLQGTTTLRAVNGTDDLIPILSDGTTGFTDIFNICVNTNVARGRNIDLSVTGRPSRETGATQCPA